MGIENDMTESIRIINSLYVELLTKGLDNDRAKDKLIKIYERIIRINTTVLKESVNSEEMAGKLISYYCDLCHATSGLFEYYRELNANHVTCDEKLLSEIKVKTEILYDKIDRLEEEVYQRDLDIEALEKDIEDRDEILMNKYVKEDLKDKFRELRGFWKMNDREYRNQLKEKDNIIEGLRSDLIKYKAEAETRNTTESLHSCENPAKRVDVDDNVIVEMYNNGMTPYNIAKQFGMTQPAIIYRLKKKDVYVKNGRKQ